MSTPATIQVDDLTFFCSHDGYPYDVWHFLFDDIEKAQERVKRNPDYLFFANLKYILMEAELPFSQCDGYPSEYQYKVDKDGKIYIKNPIGIWVEIEWVLDEDKMESVMVITSSEGMERDFENWEEYEDIFLCDCTSSCQKMVYRMVDVDGTNLEEHLVCPKCGNDVGVI